MPYFGSGVGCSMVAVCNSAQAIAAVNAIVALEHILAHTFQDQFVAHLWIRLPAMVQQIMNDAHQVGLRTSGHAATAKTEPRACYTVASTNVDFRYVYRCMLLALS